MNDFLEKEIIKRINDYETPQRITFSKKFPVLQKPVVFLHCLCKSAQNFFDSKIKYEQKNDFFDCVLTTHQSVLRRKYGNSDPVLQENKIINIRNAVEKLNGIIIKPDKVFSFWNTVGSPSSKNGYVNGRFFLNGKVVEDVGGGLCQLSTFLYWMFLHVPVTILERHNHSIDDFPDSGKNLPFRCGATVLFNYVDLKIKNNFNYPIQLKLWVTDNDLNGQIVSSSEMPAKITITENNHCFIKKDGAVFQYSEIYREESNKAEKIAVNFTRVLYDITDGYIKENNFKLFDLANV